MECLPGTILIGSTRFLIRAHSILFPFECVLGSWLPWLPPDSAMHFDGLRALPTYLFKNDTRNKLFVVLLLASQHLAKAVVTLIWSFAAILRPFELLT